MGVDFRERAEIKNYLIWIAVRASLSDYRNPNSLRFQKQFFPITSQLLKYFEKSLLLDEAEASWSVAQSDWISQV